MWCLVWCRVQSDKTDLTGLIASCFWKATPLSQLCCPSVCKFHPLIKQKKETRDFSCIGELYFLTEKNTIKTTQVLQRRKYIGRSGMDGGDGGRNLSLLLSENCYVSSPVSLVCPFKGCWHTTFVLSVLRAYMKHAGTLGGIQWWHKLDETE